MTRMTKVVALQAGHDGTEYRNAGEEFTVDLDDPRFKDSSWFEEAGKTRESKPTNKNERPPGAGPVKGSGSKSGAKSEDDKF